MTAGLLPPHLPLRREEGRERGGETVSLQTLSWKMACPRLLLVELIRPHVFVTRSRQTLCDPMDCAPPGPSVHGISRQEYWSGLSSLSPGDLPNPGTEPRSPALQVHSLPPQPLGKPEKALPTCTGGQKAQSVPAGRIIAIPIVMREENRTEWVLKYSDRACCTLIHLDTKTLPNKHQKRHFNVN